MPLPARVLAFARRQRLWTPEAPVVAAVSGGADSVAMLLVLRDLAAQGEVNLVGVAHLNHGIRGAEGDEDAAFVAALARRLRLPFEQADVDVPALARAERSSLELAARRARVAFYERIALAEPRPLIALGHTLTDQAETVILRLVRGAGSRGAAGIAPRTGRRVRPLLEESRQKVRAWLRGRGEPWREDSTNDDQAIARNYVRHSVLPALAQINPAAETALARAARIHAADDQLLEELAAAAAERLLRVDGDTVRFDLGAVRQLHEALGRRVVRRALMLVEPEHTPSWQSSDAVWAHRAGRLAIGRIRLELFGDLAVLSSRGEAPRLGPTREVPAPALPLDVPGTVSHPAGWWRVDADGPIERQAASALVTAAGAAHPSAPHQVAVDAGAVGRHLTIRSWLPGDRVQPLGLGGRKKLQDVFVDRKVPRDERVRIPIVLDAAGRIVWVAGHVIGEPFRVTPHSDGVVVLTLRR